jgi:hypothetical protein
MASPILSIVAVRRIEESRIETTLTRLKLVS